MLHFFNQRIPYVSFSKVKHIPISFHITHTHTPKYLLIKDAITVIYRAKIDIQIVMFINLEVQRNKI